MNHLHQRLSLTNFAATKHRLPVWFMRQAGRYHQHYQQLRRQHSFIDICKTPHLAAEAAWGPIVDFQFDAAILFSDILFPLEYLGLELNYDDGGPQLQRQIQTRLQCTKANSLICKAMLN